MNKKILLSAALIQFIFLSCTPEPEPIIFGQDQCVYCKMIISEQSYGAELVTNKAKVYKFDSIECLTAYYLKPEIDRELIHSLWTVDFIQTEKLIDAEKSVYLHSERLHSPMGLNLTSFLTKEDAEKIAAKYGGELLTWQEIKNLVRERWIDKE